MASRKPMAQLTPREEQIGRAVAEGRSNREIAEALALREQTVKNHLTSIYSKLGLKRRVQLALLLERQRAVESPEPH